MSLVKFTFSLDFHILPKWSQHLHYVNPAYVSSTPSIPCSARNIIGRIAKIGMFPGEVSVGGNKHKVVPPFENAKLVNIAPTSKLYYLWHISLYIYIYICTYLYLHGYNPTYNWGGTTLRYDWGFMVHRFRPVGPWGHGNLLGRHVNALESQLSINFPMVKLFNSWWWWIVVG